MSAGNRLSDFILQLSARLRGSEKILRLATEEAPLRAELYSADQMAQHGRALAATHRLDSGPAPDLLLARLADNENILVGVCKTLTSAVADNRTRSPSTPATSPTDRKW